MVTAEELLKIAPSLGKRNYEKNIRMRKPSGLINGQKSCPVSNHRLGICRMSHNGCGVIAVYNAMCQAGLDPDINVISLGIDTYALRAWGLLGTDPKKIEECMKNCRIAALKAADYNDFVNVMKSVRVGILCYWVGKPRRSLLHFVALINNGDGKYAVCNRYSNRKSVSMVNSIEKLCPEECYVCGFFMN